MWKLVVSYLPDWKVFLQAFIALSIPYVISRFFEWISHQRRIDENETKDYKEQTTQKARQSK